MYIMRLLSFTLASPKLVIQDRWSNENMNPPLVATASDPPETITYKYFADLVHAEPDKHLIVE